MFSWLFKRGIDKRFDNINSSIQGSFSNVKEDIAQVSRWINHFKVKHDDHHDNLSKILARLDSIETRLEQHESSVVYEEQIEPLEEKKENLELKNWAQLTDVQQHLAYVISSLDKEEPETWHALKKVAFELYPNREYGEVRTTISHYVRLLEEFGFVERKRVGNKSLVRTKKKELPKLRVSKQAVVEVVNDKSKKRRKKK
jgi:hypothetical protein